MSKKFYEEYNPYLHERELTIKISESELLNAFSSVRNFKKFLKSLDKVTGLYLSDCIIVKEGGKNEDT